MPRKGESKSEAFVRLGNSRVARVLEQLRLLSQLSSRSYTHEITQALQVMYGVRDGVMELANSFQIPIAIAIGEEEVALAEMTNYVVTEKSDKPQFDTVVALAAALEALNKEDVPTAKGILKQALLS